MISVCVSHIYFEFTIYWVNSLCILYEFTWCFVNFLWISYLFSWIQYEFTISFANLLWIHFFFANLSCFHSLSIADSVRIPSVLREFTLNSFSVSRIRWVFRENNMNWLSVFRWIHCLFRESTMYLLSISRIYYELTFYFAKSPRIHFPFREFIMDSLFYFANSLFFVKMYS